MQDIRVLKQMESFDKWITAYTELYPFSGIIRVSEKGHTVYERSIGFADREQCVPVTRDTRFRFYSLTKPFTALGILKLVDAGKISPEEHPGRYCKEAGRFPKEVTVRTLLNHTSGLPDFRQSKQFADFTSKVSVSNKEILDFMTELPMNSQPGEKAMYNNFNYALLSIIIENVTGQPFEEYLKNEVFLPIGAKNATTDACNRIIPNRAAGYDIDGDRIVRADVPIAWMKGAGIAMGTASDVYALSRAIVNRSLLSDSLWEQTLQPGLGDFGFGMRITFNGGRTRYIHNGGHTGFRTLHVLFPEDDTDVILLSNMGFGNARNALLSAFEHIRYGGETEIGEMDTGTIRRIETASYPELRRLEKSKTRGEVFYGEYTDGINHAALEPDGEDAVLILQGTKHLPVYYIGNGVFRHKIIDEEYRFTDSFDGMRKIR